MTMVPNILAASALGLLFAGVVLVFWIFGAIMNSAKKKPDELKKPTREMQELAEARRRIREQQNAQKPAVTPRIQQKRAKQQQRQPQQQQRPAAQQARPPVMPPALPSPAMARGLSTIAQAAPSAQMRSTQEIGAAPASRKAKSEIAKNVRLMLQRNAMAEAFVLSEVLGRPKAFDER